MSGTFNLERQTNVANNIDATGKKWEIVHIKGSALYEARPNPYRSDFVCPKEFEGRWTKHTLLDQQIKLYVNRSWDQAEKVKAANARQAQAAKEVKAGKKDDPTTKE